MPDLLFTDLDSRQQKLVENARRAFAQGNSDYVITACAQVLQAAPGCLPVRRLQRAAQLQEFSGRSGWIGKTLSRLTALPFILGSTRKEPAEALLQSDKILAKDPHSIMGLQLLAEAAAANDWLETVAFAHEAIYAIEPTDRRNLLALGEAWLIAQKPDEALRVADGMLEKNPVDGDAQNLMRKASIARTTEQGSWEGDGDSRGKLSNRAKSDPNERAGSPTPPHNSQQVEPSSLNATTPVDPLDAAHDIVERYPGDLDARFGLAELLHAAGQIEAAIAHYQHVTKSPKLRIQSLLGLARCFRARGLLDLAVTQLTTAKKELGPLDEYKKEVAYELGVSFEQMKQPESAIAEFKEIYTEDIGYREVSAKINEH